MAKMLGCYAKLVGVQRIPEGTPGLVVRAFYECVESDASGQFETTLLNPLSTEDVRDRFREILKNYLHTKGLPFESADIYLVGF